MHGKKPVGSGREQTAPLLDTKSQPQYGSADTKSNNLATVPTINRTAEGDSHDER